MSFNLPGMYLYYLSRDNLAPEEYERIISPHAAWARICREYEFDDSHNTSRYQVHHKLPLDDSGNNSFDNLVLISTRPEHAAFTTTQKHITKNLTPTGTNIVLWPKPQGIIYP